MRAAESPKAKLAADTSGTVFEGSEGLVGMIGVEVRGSGIRVGRGGVVQVVGIGRGCKNTRTRHGPVKVGWDFGGSTMGALSGTATGDMKTRPGGSKNSAEQENFIARMKDIAIKSVNCAAIGG